MTVKPGIGFTTNLSGEQAINSLIDSITDEFDPVSEGYNALELADGWKISYADLGGDFRESMGIKHDGLVFVYRGDDWPDWDVFAQRGEFITELRDFIDKETDAHVSPVKPLTPSS